MNKTAYVLLAAALATVAHAQFSTSSFGHLVVVDTGIANGSYTTLTEASGDGSPVSASGTYSFTGMDRAGATQTMLFSGSATSSAQYGRLHGVSTASLVNSYYNAANPYYTDGSGGVAVYPDGSHGSPDALNTETASSFTDTLQFGGALQDGYMARYVFHVDGTNSGPRSLAVLGVTIAGVNKTFGDGDTGPFSADWTVGDIPIVGTMAQTIQVDFDTLVSFNTPDLTDGTDYDGTADFSSTATLSRIIVVDANGNPVSGVTITSASGTVYPVPEPAAFAALGLGALGVVRRRRR